MKIGVDAGALCVDITHRFGTYTYSLSLISALKRYDNDNDYHSYAFCSAPVKTTYIPSLGWSQIWLPLISNLKNDDVFLGLNQFIPRGIHARPFVFLHGLSYMFYKKLYPDSYVKMKQQLNVAMKSADHIFVTSKKVVQELRDLGYANNNVHVLSMGIPTPISKEKVSRDFIQKHSHLMRKPYFLFAGMDHPIKNINVLVSAIKKVREYDKETRLVLFGPTSLREDKINGVYTMQGNSDELRYMYRHASAYVTASLYESLHFPFLEALHTNCPVLGLRSAVIDEFKPYVSVARNRTDLEEQMVEVLKKRVKRRKVNLSQFSWKYTVKTITDLY